MNTNAKNLFRSEYRRARMEMGTDRHSGGPRLLDITSRRDVGMVRDAAIQAAWTRPYTSRKPGRFAAAAAAKRQFYAECPELSWLSQPASMWLAGVFCYIVRA
jgi:hypothetical protein